MFAMLLVGLTLDVLAIIIHGIVLKVLWGWFVVTTFQLPALTIPQAIGIGLVVAFLTHKSSMPEDDLLKVFIAKAIYLVGTPIIAIIMGAIVKSFL